MARLARVEVFLPDEIAIVHFMNHVICRCFLLGNDPITGINYDPHRVWIEEQLQRLDAFFGVDLLCFPILSNHFHLILRSRPDVVATWDDTEIARRWLTFCLVRKNDDGFAGEPGGILKDTARLRIRRKIRAESLPKTSSNNHDTCFYASGEIVVSLARGEPNVFRV
jgi:hypothetical protein